MHVQFNSKEAASKFLGEMKDVNNKSSTVPPPSTETAPDPTTSDVPTTPKTPDNAKLDNAKLADANKEPVSSTPAAAPGAPAETPLPNTPTTGDIPVSPQASTDTKDTKDTAKPKLIRRTKERQLNKDGITETFIEYYSDGSVKRAVIRNGKIIEDTTTKAGEKPKATPASMDTPPKAVVPPAITPKETPKSNVFNMSDYGRNYGKDKTSAIHKPSIIKPYEPVPTSVRNKVTAPPPEPVAVPQDTYIPTPASFTPVRNDSVFTPAPQIASTPVEPLNLNPTNDILTKQLDVQSKMFSVLSNIHQTLSGMKTLSPSSSSDGATTSDTPTNSPTPHRRNNQPEMLTPVVDLNRRIYDRKSA
jgi:hypothetical protein